MILVEQLRARTTTIWRSQPHSSELIPGPAVKDALCQEAALEIERLRALEPSPKAAPLVGTGFAIMGANDQVDLRTVGQHERAAKVNWLWNEGIRIHTGWTDEMIEVAWRDNAPRAGVRCVAVGIVERP